VRSSTPTQKSIDAERRRRAACALREQLEALADPDWPAWPPPADDDHHRWVRAHWSLAACDRFDALQIAIEDATYAGLRWLAGLIVSEGESPDMVRTLLERAGWAVWPAGYAGQWQRWIGLHWEEHWASIFLCDLDGARRDRRYGERYCAAMLESAGDGFDKRLRRVRGEMSEAELAGLLERRVCGIRGRYRLLHSVWEKEHGISEADIDAP
jgi:hypothetical protein